MQTTIECGYCKDDSSNNHIVSLANIVPDLLFQDIDPHLLLNPEDIHYQEDDASLISKGSYCNIYHGTYQNKSVAIKKYVGKNKETFEELRSAVELLQHSSHPCLVSLMGMFIHPDMTLILEGAPCKTLDCALFQEKTPMHRLTVYRITAEVAAALHFLHQQGIIFRDLNAANVLLWTLSPTSLCHCKVKNSKIATHMAPVGTKGLRGTKGFIAPEILYNGKRNQRPTYDHKADIFSFGMFLYQMIARRLPYHCMAAHKIDVLVEKGLRPNIQDVDTAYTTYHYLTMLMKKCWQDSPNNRPKSDAIIKTVSLSVVQSIMCIFPVQSKLTLRHAVAHTPTNLKKPGASGILHSELWVCSDGDCGADLSVYSTSTMVEVSKNFIKENQVQCMALCNDHVWVGSRAGIEYGAIDIYNITTRELVHNIRLRENSVSCLVVAKDRVLIGTLEGYCFSFSSDVQSVRQNAKPHYKYVSEHAVDGIACTADFIWVSHTRYIYFLNSHNLALEGSISRDKERGTRVGHLSLAPAEDVVWSAHLGGIIVTAWDAHNRIHMFDIDTSKVLKKIAEDVKEYNMVITAMVPVLDMTWVGMATGHILLFHCEELLTWYQPYSEFVSFLTVIPGGNGCNNEHCRVVSGGKNFIPPALNIGLDYEIIEDVGGVLVIWEGYNSKMIRQINIVEKSAPAHLETYSSVRQTIQNGEFEDGTSIVCNT